MGHRISYDISPKLTEEQKQLLIYEFNWGSVENVESCLEYGESIHWEVEEEMSFISSKYPDTSFEVYWEDEYGEFGKLIFEKGAYSEYEGVMTYKKI